MFGLVGASILTIFLNKKEGNKILACLLITYILFIRFNYYLQHMILQDYLGVYTISTLLLCGSLFFYTKRSLIQTIIILSVVLPQLYYLLILYKPYILLSSIPVWWLFNVDKIFIYSVFFILYEQALEVDFRDMKFKDFTLNIAILCSLVLF